MIDFSHHIKRSPYNTKVFGDSLYVFTILTKGSNMIHNAAKSLKANDTSGIARAKYFDFHLLPSQRLQMGVLWASDHIAVMNRNWVLSDTWSKYTLIMTENDHGVVGVNSVQNGPCHT